MAEHPLLFSAPMVRAILECRKTVTRRLPKNPNYYMGWKKGDRVWVRETFKVEAYSGRQLNTENPIHEFFVAYQSDGKSRNIVFDAPPEKAPNRDGWKPSIHMPRWASRITLELTADVRREELCSISGFGEAGAIYEGCPEDRRHEPRKWFAELWDSMHPQHPWSSNPTVTVIEFKKHG